ncbi:MAG TPA: hypothetical protein VEZ70_14410 [Allosphingosinicella sp.]|nr:hypothetical protein [Allosphingosinicella sp.]
MAFGTLGMGLGFDNWSGVLSSAPLDAGETGNPLNTELLADPEFNNPAAWNGGPGIALSQWLISGGQAIYGAGPGGMWEIVTTSMIPNDIGDLFRLTVDVASLSPGFTLAVRRWNTGGGIATFPLSVGVNICEFTTPGTGGLLWLASSNGSGEVVLNSASLMFLAPAPPPPPPPPPGVLGDNMLVNGECTFGGGGNWIGGITPADQIEFSGNLTIARYTNLTVEAGATYRLRILNRSFDNPIRATLNRGSGFKMLAAGTGLIEVDFTVDSSGLTELLFRDPDQEAAGWMDNIELRQVY